MSTLKPFRVDYYIGFGKPRQTIVIQATSVSVAGDIFKAMDADGQNQWATPDMTRSELFTIDSAQRTKAKKFLL